MTDNQRAITEGQRRQARLIWGFHQMHHQARPCDVAIGLGSHDLGVAAFCAELYRAGLFETLVFTGGPNLTAPERFPRGEAVHFREHAIALGVPAGAILLEPKARNTGQNITLSREVLAAAGITPKTVLLVSMPYMERRSFATARKVWPEVEVICASEPLEFDDYLKSIGDEKLVGDLQRVIEYPKLGFAIEQDVPEDVHAAYESLFAAGFDSRLPTVPKPTQGMRSSCWTVAGR
ncbi:YdcF family protein [Streptomyces rhizosphaericus]|uniref:YdcF family protein n=1 Tax=Streptomyces rhizosphaericus TaxID=114699 RepID=UPI000A3A672F|nr:YdcF family protein [Streptomyces rhizosphaericus]